MGKFEIERLTFWIKLHHVLCPSALVLALVLGVMLRVSGDEGLRTPLVVSFVVGLVTLAGTFGLHVRVANLRRRLLAEALDS